MPLLVYHCGDYADVVMRTQAKGVLKIVTD
jgi:hypothetical protein